MPANIIVSYDGTANEDDAIVLGRLLAAAGGELSIAYVRHTHQPDRDRETLAEAEAQELVERGVQLLGDPDAGRYVVTDRSTPEGLAALADRLGADVIVFCSDSHTAKGHVSIGNSAARLLEGGSPSRRWIWARGAPPSDAWWPWATATVARRGRPTRSPRRWGRASSRLQTTTPICSSSTPVPRHSRDAYR